MSECGKSTHGGCADDSFLQVHTIVDEPNVGAWVLGLRAFLGQEVDNLSLNRGVLAVLDVLGKYHEGQLPLRWADLHDGVNDALSELQASIVLKAVCQEFQEDVSLLRETVVEQSG